MIRKVLIGVKAEPESVLALRYAANFARVMNAKLLALHVLGELHCYPFIAQIDRLRQEEIRLEKKNTIGRVKEGCRECKLIDVETKFVEGYPAKEILKEAEKWNADLIIIGSHGKFRALEFLLGGVAFQIIHYSKIPVLVAKRFRELSKILMCTDGSEYAEEAIRFAGDIAKNADSKVTLLCVVPKVAKGVEEPAKIVLERGAKLLEEKGVKAEMRIRHGDPSEEILNEARERDYSLIVMGHKGKSDVKEFLFGDVVSTVLHHSLRPTLIHKGV